METNWKTTLRSFLSGSVRPAVLGVGSPLRGDDGAGVLAARSVERAARSGHGLGSLRVFIGETAPENLTGVIIRENPDRLLIIDAVDIPGTEGDIIFIPHIEETDDISASTHRMPLKVLCTYINKSIQCNVAVIGIVPGSCTFGAEVSKKVRAATRAVAKEIARCLVCNQAPFDKTVSGTM